MKKFLLISVSVFIGAFLVGQVSSQQGGGTGQGGNPWYINGEKVIIQDSSVTGIYESDGVTPLGGGSSLGLPNDTFITGRNFADDGDIDMFKINTSDEIEAGTNLDMGGFNISNIADISANTVTIGGVSVGTVTIDVDDANAFLVQKDVSGGKILTVDTIGSQVKILETGIFGVAATPSLSFGDGDTGLSELSDDILSLVAGEEEMMRIDYNTLEVQPLVDLVVGPIEFEEDSGVVTAMNMPVSDTPSDGDVESMTFSIDSNPVLTVYSEADGAGGVDTLRAGVGVVVPVSTFETNGSRGRSVARLDAATLTLDDTHDIVCVDYTDTGAVTITLPSATSSWNSINNIGRMYEVKDCGANASVNNITIDRAGADVIITDITNDTSASISGNGDALKITAVSATEWIAH